jgi:hypothetical protein
VRQHSLVLLAKISLLLAACSRAPNPPQALNGPPRDLRASSAELYQRYGMAISAARRDDLADFYVPTGVIRILNGERRELTRAQLDSAYRGPWNPPEYFDWEDLTYDSIGVGQVVVTGGFRWKSHGGSDTVRFLYAALLEAVDSGMTIRVEVETTRPAH